MGAIHGDLSVLSLSNLIQALVLDRSSGLLSVESGLERRVLRVSPQGIRLVRGSQRCHRFERLLRSLTRGGNEAPSESTPRPFTSPEATARLMGEWMLEEICELLTWTRGTFSFHPFFDPALAKEEGPFGAYGADVEVARVALEAALWSDELPRIKAAIPDLRHVPVRTRVGAAARKRPMEAEALEDILRMIDGKRSVVQLLQLSVFPRFIVLRILYGLIQEEAVRLAVPGRAALAPAA